MEEKKVNDESEIVNGKVDDPHYKDVVEFLSPLRDNWDFMQEILLWENVAISIVCFNLVNGLFWVFLTPFFRTFVTLMAVISISWLIPPWRQWVLSKLRKNQMPRSINNSDEDSAMEDSYPRRTQPMSAGKNPTYEDFCLKVAVGYTTTLKYILKINNLKEERPQKFYCLFSLLVVLLAIVIQRFPIGNFFYLASMLFFLWPSIVFYGVKDRVVGKLKLLMKPFVTHWQNSRTKRKRNVIMKGTNDESELSDFEDDFKLNSVEDKTNTLISVVPSFQRLHQEHYGQRESLESSIVTDDLEFPSLRKDSIESVNSDDFIAGLNFGSISHRSLHSSNESLVGEVDQPLERNQPNVTENRNDEFGHTEAEVIPMDNTRTDDHGHLSRNKSSDSLQSYEIVEPSDVEFVETNSDNSEQATYYSSGTKYVGKLLGYNK